MGPTMIRLAVTLAILLAWTGQALAEPVAGRIIDGQTLQPIAGAEVTSSRGQTARSDARGYFRFDGGKPGRLRLRVRAPGYELATEALRIPEGGLLNQTIVMFNLEAAGELIEVRAKQTAPARVPPGKQEITREEITRIPGTRGDALQGVKSLPGIANVTAAGSGPGQIVVRGIRPRRFQDHHRWHSGAPALPLLWRSERLALGVHR